MVLDRLPPHDIAAEESVVASCLVDPEAIYKVAPIVRPDDFFREKNAWVFDACVSLWARNEAINQITVAHELARRERLDAIGGVAYLSRMVADLPTVIGVEYYAQIVARDATYRRLISAAGQIAQYAYEGGPDLDAVLNRAETLLMALRSGEAVRDFKHIRDLLSKYLDDQLNPPDESEAPSVIRTGFVDLDTLLGGLKRTDLIILAARPSVGKSALAMSFARNAAIGQKAKVAVFNLEMSAEQLAQRLVSAESGVDSTRLRLGEHTEAEERRIMNATGRLADCEIYIDDSPVVTIGDLRGKVRRLQQEKGLDLLLIDYLQLMQGNDQRSDNRVQEISFISRSLKNMARELNVPVVALSQLSRAVESRKPPIPMMSDLRDSGCLAGDTLIMDAATGRRHTIRDLVECGQPMKVLGLTEQFRLEAQTAVRFFSSGRKQVFRLTTRSGRSIRASENHQFRTLSGWTRLDALTPGDHIAVPRAMTARDSARGVMTEDELVLLAHLLGDGCILPRQPYHYTTASPMNAEHVSSAAQALFDIRPRLVPQRNWMHIYLPSPVRLARGRRHPLTEWFERLGIERVHSYEKRVPNEVFACDQAGIALFLRHIWSTDGNLSVKQIRNRKPSAAIYYASASAELAEQIAHLLLRLDIRSSLRTQRSARGYRPMYQVHIEGTPDQLGFLETIGIADERQHAIPAHIRALNDIASNTNVDAIPRDAWRLVVAGAKDAAGLSWRDVAQGLGVAYNGSASMKTGIGRERLARIGAVLASPRCLELATSDVLWDAVISIEKEAVEEVFDATVPGVHNFVANDIVVHNSIEQDADVVMFIYREDYYTQRDDWQAANPEQPGRSFPHGIAQVIVAKHRNGPVGTVDLRFHHKVAKFEDLYPREDGQ